MLVDERDGKTSASYFLISVSTRENLELCVRHQIAGFPGGENGAWTFCEISEGDFVSFLYGARAYNLYRVSRKEAITGAERVPPWKPLVFSESGKTYSFPYRLNLQLVRTFVEPIARTEFLYVAENLLLRGGYRKTHFQADQTTLQSVSQMGTAEQREPERLDAPPFTTFSLCFTRNRAIAGLPEVCIFRETVLQSAIRRSLGEDQNLEALTLALGVDRKASDLEVLGEKALPQGHVDLLVKERIPLGSSLRIPIEVKTKSAKPCDIDQLLGYVVELGPECPFGVLLASDFTRQTVDLAKAKKVKLIRYSLGVDLATGSHSFHELWSSLRLHAI